LRQQLADLKATLEALAQEYQAHKDIAEARFKTDAEATAALQTQLAEEVDNLVRLAAGKHVRKLAGRMHRTDLHYFPFLGIPAEFQLYREHAEQHIAALENKARADSEALAALQTIAKDQAAEIEELSQQLDNMHAQSLADKDALALARSQLADKETAYDGLARACEAEKEQAAKALADMEAHQKQNLKSIELLEAAGRRDADEIAGLRKALAEAKQAAEDAQQRGEGDAAAQQAANERIAELENQLKTAEAAAAELKADQRQLFVLAKEFKEYKATSEAAVKDLEDMAAADATSVAALKAQVKRDQEEVDSLRRQLAEARDVAEAAAAEVVAARADAQKRVDDLTFFLDKAKAEASRLLQERQDATALEDRLMALAHEFEAYKGHAETTITDLKAAIQRDRVELVKVATLNEELEKINQKQESHLRALATEFAVYKEGAEKSIATLGGAKR
jgi:hypothetical protein